MWLWMQAVTELHLFSVNIQTAAAVSATAVNMKNDYNNAIMNSTYSAHLYSEHGVVCTPPKRTETDNGCEIIEGDNLSSLNNANAVILTSPLTSAHSKLLRISNTSSARFRATLTKDSIWRHANMRIQQYTRCGNNIIFLICFFRLPFVVCCVRFCGSFVVFDFIPITLNFLQLLVGGSCTQTVVVDVFFFYFIRQRCALDVEKCWCKSFPCSLLNGADPRRRCSFIVFVAELPTILIA